MWETSQNHDFDTEIIAMASIKEFKPAARILLAKTPHPCRYLLNNHLLEHIP